MAGTRKRKNINKTPDSSDEKLNNKRKLSDSSPLESSTTKKSNRAKTPTKKILESGIALSSSQTQTDHLTTAEQRQKAIEWAKEVLPNTRKTPRTPKTPSTKKENNNSTSKLTLSEQTQKANEFSNTKEPNSKKSPEKTITAVPSINTPVPKNSNTAQKRIRVKEISITIDDNKKNNVKPLFLKREDSYQLTIPGKIIIYII
jgi:hypothetical protein